MSREDAAVRDTWYLGIDGGGTRTRALLADREGRICGAGSAASANRNHYTRDEVRDALRQAIREASGGRADVPIASIFLGLGGVSTDADREDIRSVVREIPEIDPSTRVTVDNDTVVGLAGGLSGKPGMALIAGTGSACFGVNGRGERWMCGGWGALADDIGSAAWIGLEAVRAAVQAEDGRLPPTLLRDIVFDFLGLKDPRHLIRRVHNEGLERAELGTLAPRVIEAYLQGDGAAAGILFDAIAGLTELVATTNRRLFGNAPADLILVGGLALSGPPFQPELTEMIRSEVPNVTVRQAEMSPVQGAVVLALRAAGIELTPDRLANLRAVSGISLPE